MAASSPGARERGVGSIEGEPGQLLGRSDGHSVILGSCDPSTRLEIFELLAQGSALCRDLKSTLANAQSSNEQALAQFEGAGGQPTGSTSGSAALGRARTGNAEELRKLRTALEEAEAAQAATQRELEGERARRVAAEAKMEQMRAAWERAAASQGGMLPPPGGSPNRSGSVHTDVSPVDQQIEHLRRGAEAHAQQKGGPGQFVSNAVVGALAGTASNAVKVLGHFMPRSPAAQADEGDKAKDGSQPFAVNDISQSSGPYGNDDD